MSVPVLDSSSIFAAVTPEEAVRRTHDAFLRHHAGEWAMPPKLYVEAPPAGDFRAMPARGAGLAILKWVTSFPGNPERGLPVVAGAVLVSSDVTGEMLAILDCAAVTSLRTGAAAAVSAQALARSDARSVGIVGCGVNGAWAARCLAAAGYGPGTCADLRPEAAGDLAAELGWVAGTTAEALAADIVVTGCRLFCDEWQQASTGGELAGPVASGLVGRGDVTDLGSVLAGRSPGRLDPNETTLFDSTGLAIQDLAIAMAVVEALDRGDVEATLVTL